MGTTTYGYDARGNLSTFNLDLAAATNDLSRTFTRNPAGQITGRTSSNTLYRAPPQATGSTLLYAAANKLNQLTTITTPTATNTAVYDGRGNFDKLTSGASTLAEYSFDLENRLTAVDGNSFTYDPAGRLAQVAGSETRAFLYDGPNLIGEYQGGGIVARYVHGPGADEPLMAIQNGVTSYFVADERGSIVALSNPSGVQGVQAYDEYGRAFQTSGSSGVGRFGFTGQTWFPQAGLNYYKARWYSPTLGRFMSADPLGYDDGPNMYAYVGNDPMNLSDPSGREKICLKKDEDDKKSPESCVLVDGDGDGKSNENDLDKGQADLFRDQFKDFIRTHAGRDLSHDGKLVWGKGDDSDKAMVRVASQFIGRAAKATGGKRLSAGMPLNLSK